MTRRDQATAIIAWKVCEGGRLWFQYVHETVLLAITGPTFFEHLALH